MSSKIREKIREKGLDLGFDVVRFCKPVDNTDKLKAWLAEGYHGEMAWMADKPEVRGNPKGMWPEMGTVISVGYNYGPKTNPLEGLKNNTHGNISCYAWNEDYHDVIKKKLKAFAREIVAEFPCELKVFVDTAPVMEKPLAQEAGIGWQGKHTCVVSRQFGSWLFLGAMYLTLDLPADEKEVDHCGKCSRCVDVCPTQAFVKPRVLDARKCISYLTIEHKGEIPHELRSQMGNHIYGCDDCLAACPWNKFAKESAEMKFWMRENAINLPLSEYAQLDDASFREMFRKSPIKRIGVNRFLRNVMIAIGNSGDRSLLKSAQKHIESDDIVLAEAARWAVAQIQR